MLRIPPVLMLALLLAGCATDPTSTPTPPPSPNPIPNLQAMTVHDRLTIELSWGQAPGPANTYVIQRAESESGPWAEIARLPATEPRRYMDDDGLQDNQRYWYRVITALDDGQTSEPSAPVNAIATDLPRPTPTPTTS
jgi:hypothetical protein